MDESASIPRTDPAPPPPTPGSGAPVTEDADAAPGSPNPATTSTTNPQPGRLTPAALAGPLLVAVAAAVALWWAISLVNAGPKLPGRPQADPFTAYVSAFGDLVVRLASVVTLGALVAIVALVRPDADHRLSPATGRLTRVAAHAGQLWLWASVLQTFANSAYVNGVPLGYTVHPDAWWQFQSATPSGLAWLLSALVAAGCVVVAYAARTVAPVALAYLAGILALTFVAVTGTVTIGADHDWATDSAIWLTLAFVVAATLAIGVWLSADADGAASARVRRYQWTALPLLVVALAGHAVVAWQQLAGTDPTASLYGRVALGQLAVIAALIAMWLIRQVAPITTVIPDVMLIIAGLALASAENHVPSPRFGIPQNVQINYLGYEMNVPATIERLLGLGRPNVLWVGLAAVAIGTYLWGVARVRRAGRPWPIQRTLTWSAGWLLMLYLAVSGLWEYSTALYSWHMFVHMTVNMLVPALCVLGGPITLAREASRTGTILPDVRGVTDALFEHRPLSRVFSPPVLWLNYVGSLFLIYYTPLFPWLMRYHWAHQLMLLYFMVTGYLFFAMIVGVDKQLTDLPHLVRLAMVISIMPFHALFAVGIMSSRSLIGGDFYRSIDISWIHDLMADQSTAGQVTWILGEIPLFVVMIALAAQWFTHDRAENAVSDVAQDTGVDDSFDSYNDMLAALAERDRQSGHRVL